MSQTQVRQTKMTDKQVLIQLAKKLNAQVLGEGTHGLYQTRETGFGIQLPDWNYPIVFSPDGQLKYDTYHGRWGSEQLIDQLPQKYAVAAAEVAYPDAIFEETVLENGELELTVTLAGAAETGNAFDGEAF